MNPDLPPMLISRAWAGGAEGGAPRSKNTGAPAGDAGPPMLISRAFAGGPEARVLRTHTNVSLGHVLFTLGAVSISTNDVCVL